MASHRTAAARQRVTTAMMIVYEPQPPSPEWLRRHYDVDAAVVLALFAVPKRAGCNPLCEWVWWDRSNPS